MAFVIVNWNGGILLREALDSIRRHPPRVAFEVVVVDNASTDGSLAWLRSDAARELLAPAPLRLIGNAANAGFGAANNQAFAATSAPLLFLLNPDAALRPGACDTLLAALAADPGAGACGPRLVNPDGSLQVSVRRNPPTVWATLLANLQLYRLLPRRLRGELLLGGHWAHDRRRAVPLLGGAAILARREMIDRVGGFDEAFHMYGEDDEWCLRITRAGWRLLFEPKAVVVHHGGASGRQRWTGPERMRRQHEAHFRFLRQSLTRRQRLANLRAARLVLALQARWQRLRGRPAEELALAARLHADELAAARRERAER